MNSGPPAQHELLRSLRVLIVDDSAEMCRLLVALFATMGTGDVACAASGEEGLRLFASGDFDLIITDGTMQPMDGYEMTRAIRAMNETKGAGADLPVLMISGHRDKELVTRARDNGVTDYIVKPVTAELLYERVLAAILKPIHLIEMEGYRGPSPTRRLVAHKADMPSGQPRRGSGQEAD